MVCNQRDLMDVLAAIGRILTCYLCCDNLSDDEESDQTPLIPGPSIHRIRKVDAWLSRYNHAAVLTSGGYSSELPFHGCDDKELADEAESPQARGTSSSTPAGVEEVSEKLEVSPIQGEDCNDSGLKELKDEVHFLAESLKAYGTLLETPAGIEEVSEKLEVSPIHATQSEATGKESGSQEHTPCGTLLETPAETRKLSDKLEVSPTHAATHDEALRKQCGSPKHTPIRSLVSEVKEGSEFENPYSINNSTISAVTPGLPFAATQRKNKSVRFEIQVDTEPCFSRRFLEQSDSYDKSCSTPLYITDDMQTPGTVYASNQKTQGRWMIRSQYVRSVLKPIDNIPPWKAVKKDVNSQKQGHESGNPCDMDSPILGVVTQHLNYEEPCRISDDLLALDEKVTFIGRLEKALSEKTVI